MDIIDFDYQIFKKKRIITKVAFFIAVLIFCFNSNKILGQEKNTITDFYEYANKEWLDNTIIPEKVSVINNWGILWDEIIDKSIEILSDKVQYELDENNQYILIQLQNFYKSAAENITCLYFAQP